MQQLGYNHHARMHLSLWSRFALLPALSLHAAYAHSQVEGRLGVSGTWAWVAGVLYLA